MKAKRAVAVTVKAPSWIPKRHLRYWLRAVAHLKKPQTQWRGSEWAAAVKIFKFILKKNDIEFRTVKA